MTLNLVLRAVDGFLALSDGLRVGPPDDEGVLRTREIDDQKLLAVPGASAVIMTAGRATFNRIHVSNILAEVLKAGEGIDDLASLARRCADALTTESARVWSPHSAHLLLVGYDSALEFQALQIDVPPTDTGDGPKNVRDVSYDPQVPVIARPPSNTSSLLQVDFDAFVDSLDENAATEAPLVGGYRYAGLNLSVMKPFALARLRDWLIANHSLADEDGIGGLWSIAEVRAAQLPYIEHGLDLV